MHIYDKRVYILKDAKYVTEMVYIRVLAVHFDVLDMDCESCSEIEYHNFRIKISVKNKGQELLGFLHVDT